MSSSSPSSSRRRRNPSEDRLSSLSDHLLHQIFKFLFFHEIIPTALLSRRFRDLWTTSPTLRFNDHHHVNLKEDVNRALLLYNSTTLQNLEISCSGELTDAASANIIPWIRFAVRHNIQHLHLDFDPDINFDSHNPHPHRPRLHSSLYNCLSLQSLALRNFNLNQPSIHLPSLKILHVSNCTLSNIQLIVDACPRMEELKVFYCELDDLKIDARNHNYLKNLILSEAYLDEPIQVKNIVEVLAPKLASLTLYGILRHRYFIAKLPSLSVARLSLADRIPWHNSYLEDFDFGQLMKMILAVSHVQTLELCDWSFLAIAMREIKQEDTILLSATRLELRSGLSEWAFLGISYLFKGLHHLQYLKILIYEDIDSEVIGNASSSNTDAYGFSEYKYCKPLDDILSHGLCQLKTIEFVNFMRGERHIALNMGKKNINEYLDSMKEVWLLKCFLKNVVSLEKVVIKLSLFYNLKPKVKSVLSRKLPQLPRASSNVKFVFI